MVYEILRFVCVFVGVMGALLAVLDLYGRFESSLFLGGVFLVVLAWFTAVDLWVLPTTRNGVEMLIWLRAQHIVGVASVLLLFRLYGGLAGVRNVGQDIAYAIWSVVVACLMCTDWLLRLQDGEIAAGWAYFPAMGVTTLYFAWHVSALLAEAHRRGDRQQRRFGLLHAVGFGLLTIAGLADALVMWRIGAQKLALPSCMTLGMLMFSMAFAYSFVERFAYLLADRRAVYLQLRDAYEQIAHSLPLQQLGQAAGMVNHEIVNQVFLVRDNLEGIRRCSLSEAASGRIDDACNEVDSLRSFSRDMLKAARTQQSGPRRKSPCPFAPDKGSVRAEPLQYSSRTIPGTACPRRVRQNLSSQ